MSIYYCGQESLRRNGIALIVNKRVQSAVLGCISKHDKMISVCFQGKPFNIKIVQFYAPTLMLKKLKLNGTWRPTRLSRTNIKRRYPFHLWGLECKSRKSKDTWVTGKFSLGGQNKAGQSLKEFCQENALVIANTLFHNTRDDSTHGHHQMVNTEIRSIIFFVARDGEALYTQQKQDQELTVAQIMNSLLVNSDLNWRK